MQVNFSLLLCYLSMPIYIMQFLTSQKGTSLHFCSLFIFSSCLSQLVVFVSCVCVALMADTEQPEQSPPGSDVEMEPDYSSDE